MNKLVKYGSECLSSDGYILIKIKDRGWIRKHRYIMEQYLKRKLSIEEIVHHINGIKTNNKIENLAVLTKSAHSSLTHKGKIINHKVECNCCICKNERGEYKGDKNPNYIHGNWIGEETDIKKWKKEQDHLYYLKNKEKIKQHCIEYYYNGKGITNARVE